MFLWLICELQALFFELDSEAQTLKQHLGVREGQDKKTDELINDGKVPQSV